MSEESQSASFSDNPEFLFTHIEASSNKRHPNETFDPTTILDEAHNVALYRLWKGASPGTFKTKAVEVFSKEELVLDTMKQAGLLLDYYVYTMQYMFEVRKWVPKGTRR